MPKQLRALFLFSLVCCLPAAAQDSSAKTRAEADAVALQWYRKAAGLGYARAKYNVGFMYDNGRGVAKDFAEAQRWYRASAEAGYAPGMASTGHMYETAAGVNKDYAETTQWYKRAADAGDPLGMLYLGLLFESGQAVPQPGGEVQDSAQAFALFEKAAQAGNAAVMYHMGVAYEKDSGATANQVTATDWYQKASAAGSQEASAWLSAHNTPPNGTYRVGGGVSQPTVAYKKEPAYTEEASKMRVVGSVLLSIVVATDGVPRDIRIVRPLGFGLDQRAIETVRTWRFNPGMKDGHPVNVRAQIEINFRLLDPACKDVWRPAQMVFEKPEGESGPLATNAIPLVVGGKELNGSASFEFVVEANGLASNVRTIHASNPQVAEEIAKRMAKWNFGYADKPGVPAGSVGRVRFILNAGDEDSTKPLFPPQPVTPAK